MIRKKQPQRIKFFCLAMACTMLTPLVDFVYGGWHAPAAFAQNPQFNPTTPSSPKTAPPLGFQPPAQNNNNKAKNTSGTIIKTIKILGAQKVAPATIVSYLPFKIGDPWRDGLGNDALRILNNTGLFALITIDQIDGVVTISIMESPIIDQIAFEGNEAVDDQEMLQLLSQNNTVKARTAYSRSLVKKAVNIIQQVYLQRGFFQANVTPRLIDIGNNRVQLVFAVNEGEVPKVGGLEFYGNDSFSEDKLRGVVASTAYNPLRFFSTTDIYDPSRIKTDQDNLLRFYQDNGFADAAILSATSQLDKSRGKFTITYGIKEGPRYRVNKIKLTSKIKRINIKELEEHIDFKKGSFYKISSIEKTESDIVAALRDDYNYPFMRVVPKITTRPDSKTVDITLTISQGPRQYINRIIITGNGRTLDSIIRRRFPIAEGDPMDQEAISRGLRSVQNTGYFSSVVPRIMPVPGRPDRVDVIIDVQETSTGALNFSAGYSTKDGIVLGVTFGENNLLGTARVLTFNGQFAIPVADGQGDTFGQSYVLSYTEPFLADKDLSMTTSIYRTVNSNVASLLTETRTGSSFGFRFNYNANLAQYFYYNFYHNKISLDTGSLNTTATGSFYTSSFGQQISFDTRDNPADPRSGFYATFANDLAGLAGDIFYLRTTATAAGYISIPIGLNNDPVVAIGMDTGYIFPFNNQSLNLTDRFYLGGTNLRGFQDYSVGPNQSVGDATSFLGGRQYFTQSSELRIPIDILSDIGAKFLVFNDIGVLTFPDERGFNNVNDRGTLRASWGLGGSFITPVGPIVVSWAFPYLRQPNDIVQNFRLDFQSKF